VWRSHSEPLKPFASPIVTLDIGAPVNEHQGFSVPCQAYRLGQSDLEGYQFVAI
jgi:hypothetical protein